MPEITRAIETRATIDNRNGRKTISGYAAKWYDGTPATEYLHPRGYYERYDRHCFDRSLASGERKYSCFNHNYDFTLGRSDLGTADFWTDDVGMMFGVPFDDQDCDHTKVQRKIDKGLIEGASVRVDYRPRDQHFTREDGKDILTFKSLTLKEAGPVDEPAQAGTTAMIRSTHGEDQHTDHYTEWKEDQARIQKLEQMDI